MTKKSLLSRFAIPMIVATFLLPSYTSTYASYQKSINYSPIEIAQRNTVQKEAKKVNFLEKIVETNEPQKQLSKKDKKIIRYIHQVHKEIRKKESLPEYISPKYISIVAKKESDYNQYAESPVGAKGLMQIMDQTWEEMGGKKESYFNSKENLRIGIRYLNQIATFCEKNHPNWEVLSRKEKIEIISAAYNGGQSYLKKKNWNIEKMPRETKNYVKDISAQMGRT